MTNSETSSEKRLTWNDQISVLIIAGNEGLGLHLTQSFLKRKLDVLIVTHEPNADTTVIEAMQKQYEHFHIIPLEFGNPDKFEEFANSLDDLIGDTGLNLLVNHPGDSTAFRYVGDIDYETYQQIFMMNLIAPMLLIKEVQSYLKKSARINLEKPWGIQRALVVNFSTILADVNLNSDGKYWGYRESKSALEQATRSAARELLDDGVLVVCLQYEQRIKNEKHTNGDQLVEIIFKADKSKCGQLILADNFGIF